VKKAMKIIAVRVPHETYDKFADVAARANTTITAELREMIDSYCDDTGVK
jgi:predicted DNA-binding protein